MAKQLEIKYKNSALVSEDEIKEIVGNVSNYVGHLNNVAENGDYNPLECSINLPNDAQILDVVEKTVKEKKTGKLKYVIVVGIGGSNLGTMAVYNSLRGQLDAYLQKGVKLIFADTVSVKLISQLSEVINSLESADEVLLNVISKSGSTAETISNFEVLFGKLKKKFGAGAALRVVVTTDYESNLWNLAYEKGLALLSIPKNVGGRFSVFSSVGLFPLAVAGVKIDELLQGALTMRKRCLAENVNENLALISAVLTYAHYQKGIGVNDNFFFNPEMEAVGKWYRQLMGESIGKEKDLEANIVNAGITPMVSIGSTDLHSMVQLYLGGPNDKFTNLIYSLNIGSGVDVPKDLMFSDISGKYVGMDLNEIMLAILGGVKKAYENRKKPFVEVILPEVSERYLGEFLQFKMMEMMYLAKLMNLNAFDQPNVEEYKQETRKILDNK